MTKLQSFILLSLTLTKPFCAIDRFRAAVVMANKDRVCFQLAT